MEYASRYDEPLPERQCPIHQVLQTSKPLSMELKVRHRDSHQFSEGKWVTVEVQAVPLLDEKGQLQGVAEIFRDIERTGHHTHEYRELKLAASRDALTSVANRGELETQLAIMLKDFADRSAPDPFSVIFLDVDHFKSINDTFGHTAGDQVLVDVAKLLQHDTYSGEVVGRYGGEEFVILCPATDLENAIKRAERLRIALCGSDVGNLPNRKVSASFGVTTVEPGDSIESVLRRADKALYQSKENGRNRTSALTSEQLMANEQRHAASEEPAAADGFVYSKSFQACIASDMVVYKLGGFVSDFKAQLVEVTPKRAVLRVGSAGLLPFWGQSDERRPVEVDIDFSGQLPERRNTSRGGAPRVEITACVRPMGWIRNSDVFQARAHRVVKYLRSYFMSD